jgi:hypothetical protein
MSSKMQQEKIAPARAQELLALNRDNRRVRANVVSQYARDMTNGRWVFTGAPVIVNGNRLLDGQHRLLAVVQSGVTVQAMVLYSDESIHFAIDRGARRSLADELRWRGETDTNSLSAALLMLWEYTHDTLRDPRSRATISDALQFLEEHPTIRESSHVGSKIYRAIGLPRPQGSVVHYLLANEHDQTTADLFVESVCGGDGLPEGDPVLALRRYTMNVAMNRRVRPDRVEWLAVTLKAANFWLLGAPISQLRWQRVGKSPEVFPKLLRADEL